MNAQDNEQTRILREILKWIKFAGMKEVKSTLITVLDNEQKKLVYQLSDGSRGTVEIAKLAGIGSNRTVADMWQSWLKLSLGESIPVRGGTRFKRSFDLTDYGIEVPPVKEEPFKRQPESETTQVQSPKTNEGLEVNETQQSLGGESNN
jgi:hypothetical protein